MLKNRVYPPEIDKINRPGQHIFKRTGAVTHRDVLGPFSSFRWKKDSNVNIAAAVLLLSTIGAEKVNCFSVRIEIKDGISYLFIFHLRTVSTAIIPDTLCNQPSKHSAFQFPHDPRRYPTGVIFPITLG